MSKTDTVVGRRGRKPILRRRLLETGRDLFYKKGYYNTGVRDIARGARTALSSFYDHFESKEDLALQYLLAEEAEMQQNLRAIMHKYPNVRDCFRAWIVAKKKDIRSGRFVGCPFAGFVYQSARLQDEHRAEITRINRNWEHLLQQYVESAIESGQLRTDTSARDLSRRILMLYQGGVAGWRLTDNVQYIKLMECAILEEIDKHTSSNRGSRE